MEGGIVSIEGKAVIDLGQYRSIRRVKGGIMGVPVGGRNTDAELIFEGNENEVSEALKKIEEAVDNAQKPPGFA